LAELEAINCNNPKQIIKAPKSPTKYQITTVFVRAQNCWSWPSQNCKD